MKFLLIITSGPYGSTNSFHAIMLAESILKANHSLRIFLYGDGVYNALESINPANDEFNPLFHLINIHLETKILLCQSASSRRGVSNKNIHNSFEISSLTELADIIGNVDRVIRLWVQK